MKNKVIAYKNLPTKWPLVPTAVIYLVLDRLDASKFYWGLMTGIIFILWLSVAYIVFTQEQVNIFDEGKDK